MSRKYVDYDGQIKSIAEWARHLGLCRKNLAVYLRKGYSIHDVVTGKIRKRGQRTAEGEARKNAAVTKHGHAKNESQTSEYRAWADMKNRCTNPKIRMYRFYGARGITVCQRWADSFDSFLADMGPRPSVKHSIDRIDNNGNYEPGNCRWATREQQDNNRRDIHFLEFNGVRLSVSQWARRLGVTREMLFGRIRRGWTTEQIILGNHPSARGPRLKRNSHAQ